MATLIPRSTPQQTPSPLSNGKLIQGIPYKPSEEQMRCNHLNYTEMNREQKRRKILKKIRAIAYCPDCKVMFVSPAELVFGGDDKDGK